MQTELWERSLTHSVWALVNALSSDAKCVVSFFYPPGKDTGPSADLVSQMMEEALGQSDVSKDHYEEYVEYLPLCGCT